MSCQADVPPVRLCPVGTVRRVLSDLRGRRATLMGLGLFGGGEGAARFLAAEGAELTVTDLRPEAALAAPLERLSDLSIRYRLGEHRMEDFTDVALVVANPAVSRSSAFLRAAGQAGVPVTSPMNIFLALCPAPVAGVTGSNGKSTTAALLALMLRCAGERVWLGGNIGVSLLESLPAIRPDDVVVLELSSFQLSDAAALEWSPHVAVVTNVTPNHLAWHGSFEEYAAAKHGIVRFQRAEDFAVLNAQSDVLQRWVREGLAGQLRLFDPRPEGGAPDSGMSLVDGRLVWREGRRDEVVCAQEDVPLPGFHNVENAMAAATAARCLAADAGAVREALKRFVGLAHRLELVGEFEGVRFYNDSYSTTAESAVAALESFRGPLILIAGGYDKQLDLTPMARAAARSVEVLVTLGQTGPRLAQRTRQESLYVGRSVAVREAESLEEAVAIARELSMPGTVVVFSPGCASYDMFRNYRHRGEAFKQLVRQHFRGRRRCQGA